MARRESAARKARATHDESVGPVRGKASAARGATADGEPAGPAETGALALDRIIHERMRLGIVSALAADEALTFTELRGLLQTSDGNLSVHARKLEEAGYVSCRKGFEGRVPRTEYRLTSAGRKALARYLDHMEALIRTARER